VVEGSSHAVEVAHVPPCHVHAAEAVKAEHPLANGNAEAEPASEPGAKPEPAGELDNKMKPADADGAAADGDEKAVSGDAEPAAKVRMLFTPHAECPIVACIAPATSVMRYVIGRDLTEDPLAIRR